MNVDRNQIVWLAVLLACIFLLWLLSDVLLPFVGGIALAYIQAPLADRLERAGMNRTAAALLIVSGVIAGIILLTLLLVPLVSEQMGALAAATPGLAARLQATIAHLGAPWLQQIFGEDANGRLPRLMAQSPGAVPEFLRSVWSSGKAMVSFLSVIAIMPVVVFYVICDWHLMIDTVDSWIPPCRRETVHRLATEIDAAVSGFLRGQAVICAIAGLYYAIALSFVGLDFAVVIGLLNGALTIVPYVGSAIGALLAVGMAIGQFWPQWMPMAIVSIILAIGQFITAYVLGPKLVGKNVGLHPVWLLFAMVAFGYLFGFAGLLVAVPLAAAIAVLLRYWLGCYYESPLYRGNPSSSAQ